MTAEKTRGAFDSPPGGGQKISEAAQVLKFEGTQSTPQKPIPHVAELY